jgi:hypothetical protein
MITEHARLRARQRAGQGQEGCQDFYGALWALGRPAGPRDFSDFLMCKLVNREYRVAIRGGCAYMVVRGCNSDFITVTKKR